MFPSYPYSQHDEDEYFTMEREPVEHIKERTIAFLEWLNHRPEKCIAVVTHSSFLRHLFMQFGADHAPSDKADLQRSTGNCELRSVVLCSHGVKDGRVLKKMTRHAGGSPCRPCTPTPSSSMMMDPELG